MCLLVQKHHLPLFVVTLKHAGFEDGLSLRHKRRLFGMMIITPFLFILKVQARDICLSGICAVRPGEYRPPKKEQKKGPAGR